MPRMARSERERIYDNLMKNISFLLCTQNKSNLDLAGYLSITPPTWRRYKANPQDISLNMVFNMANYFNIKPETLLFGKSKIERIYEDEET